MSSSKSFSVPNSDAYHSGEGVRKSVVPSFSSSSVAALSNIKYEHLLAGISGGIASTLALHPLDLLKVRLAGLYFYTNEMNCKTNHWLICLVNDGLVVTRPKYTGLTNAVTTIFRQEGIKGFYRGVTPNIWGAGASWGLYFLL